MIKSQSDTQLQLAGLDPLQNREFKIRKRDGRMDVFQDNRIYRAIEKAFKAATGLDEASALPEPASRTPRESPNRSPRKSSDTPYAAAISMSNGFRTSSSNS